MNSAAELELTYNILNAPMRMFPFPHLYINNVFPDAYYRELVTNLPDPSHMKPIAEVRPVQGYKERFVMEMNEKHLSQLAAEKKLFWEQLAQWMTSGRLANTLLSKFEPFVKERFKNAAGIKFYNETLLVEDITHYSLGPHSDATRKVITVLFYLPKDTSQSHLGTSVYVPKDQGFTCQGGPHYTHDKFNRVHTMPFLPNSVFIFLKTANSFHGVEPVTDPDCKRWLLLFDIYFKQETAA